VHDVDDNLGPGGYEVVENDLPDDLTQAVEKGSRCDSKELYFVQREDDPTKFSLVEEKPANFGNEESGKTRKAREAYAVNVLYRFDDDVDEWVVSEVRVNSTKLHTALEKILEGYPGLTQHELKSFAPPFLPFVHRWEDMLTYTDSVEKDEIIQRHRGRQTDGPCRFLRSSARSRPRDDGPEARDPSRGYLQKLQIRKEQWLRRTLRDLGRHRRVGWSTMWLMPSELACLRIRRAACSNVASGVAIEWTTRRDEHTPEHD
jgi:hypothetical protein